jgi:hypothetical protein
MPAVTHTIVANSSRLFGHVPTCVLQGDQPVTVPDKCLRSKIRGVALSCIAMLSSFPALCSDAAETAPAPEAAAVDQSALFRELTLTRNQDGRMTMAMWMPDEFWRTTLQSSRRMTDKGITEYIAVVHPYTLIAVLDAQSGFTALRYTDVDTLLNEVSAQQRSKRPNVSTSTFTRRIGCLEQCCLFTGRLRWKSDTAYFAPTLLRRPTKMPG